MRSIRRELIPLLVLFSFSAFLVNNLVDFSSFSNRIKTLSPKDLSELEKTESQKSKLLELCSQKGIELRKYRDYDSNTTQVELPRGVFFKYSFSHDGTTSQLININLEAAHRNAQINHDETVDECGSLNFLAISKSAKKVGDLDKKILSFDQSTPKDEKAIKYWYVSIKDREALKDTLIFGFYPGYPPILLRSLDGGGSGMSLPKNDYWNVKIAIVKI
ncbi:MAG: hypothetical protein ACRCXZ_00240 [Patescibacteria group bacterium]